MYDSELILASGSPRRRELLERLGLRFTVQAADVDETLQPGLDVREQVLRLSQIKAAAVAETAPEGAVILSADTVVALDGAILGKPADPAQAVGMLSALSGRTHRVLTGVTVRSSGALQTHCEETLVRFRPLDPQEIRAYVQTGDPMDKAGAYGIQGLGAIFVAGIDGDFYNVMGLPLCAAAQMLRRAGIPILEDQA